MPGIGEGNQKKRKLPDGPEIEIDISAPEPPSKKALRKAKKQNNKDNSDANAETKPKTPIDDQEASQKRSEYGIWIGNLAFSVTKDDIRQFLTSNCSITDATITRIHLPKSAEKHGKPQNKGFAYVDFSKPESVAEAVGLSEQLLSGRRVLIKDAKSFDGRPKKTQQEGQESTASTATSGRPPSKRIFVGNLGFDATKEVLEEHFAKCGTVTNVHLATFQDSGKCKGYAWVEFEDLAAAEAAVKGFKMVNEDDEEQDGSDMESENRSKPKKPRQKRVWVNQLLGRRMRMEFAEDATTRYKKRFGKDAESRTKDMPDITEVRSGSREQDSDERAQNARHARPKKAKPEYSRYGEETVQKLSGAIVEAQGKKITFD